MFEAGRDFEVDNFAVYENSLFVLGKAADKHKKLDRLNIVLLDSGDYIYKKMGVTTAKTRFEIKEDFNRLLAKHGVDIEKEFWKVPINKVALGISQKRYGKTLGKKELDEDIAEHDFANLCKFLEKFSKEQGKVVLVVSHFDEYVKESNSLQVPHAHVVYNKFTKFEKNSLGNFLINE